MRSKISIFMSEFIPLTANRQGTDRLHYLINALSNKSSALSNKVYPDYPQSLCICSEDLFYWLDFKFPAVSHRVTQL